MVVIVILGVLAALVVPKVLERPDEARAVAAKSDIATIMQALKLYRLDNQRYPTGEQGLGALVAKPEQPPVPPNWKPGGYLENLPKDPWRSPYHISIPACGAKSTCSASAPTASRAAPAKTPTSARGTCSARHACARPRGRRAAARRFHADRDPRRHRRSSRSPRASRWSPTTATTATAPRAKRALRRRARARRARAQLARRDAGRVRRRRRLALLARDRRIQPLASGRDDDVLAPHTLPAGMIVIRSSYAGQALPSDAIVPLRATGRNEPFAFVVQGKARASCSSADPLNRVTMQVQTEPPP